MTHITQETPRETVERCQAHGATWYGDRVSFSFRAGSVDAPRATVKATFARHGFGDFLTSDPRPETLLKDCKNKGQKPRGYISREFVSPNPDTPLAVHVTKVTGNDESGDKYTCLARVRIGHRRDPVSGDMVPFAVARPPEGQTEFSDNTARERAMWIANTVNHRLTHVVVGDVTSGCRKALESLGAAKSMGGGNNYWVPSGIAERVHSFISDVERALGMYYERDPKTSMGAKHNKALMATAAQASLEDGLKEMEAELSKAVDDAANPKLTGKGKPRKKTATLQHKIDMLQGIQAKADLFSSVVENRVTARLTALREKLENHFTTLLDGGSVLWVPEGGEADPPSSDEEPAPRTERSPGSDESPAVAAASKGDEDPFGWIS